MAAGRRVTGDAFAAARKMPGLGAHDAVLNNREVLLGAFIRDERGVGLGVGPGAVDAVSVSLSARATARRNNEATAVKGFCVRRLMKTQGVTGGPSASTSRIVRRTEMRRSRSLFVARNVR